MTTIGIIGAGHVGSQVARAAVAHGYEVVVANSRGAETLERLVAELGPSARAGTAVEAAAAGDFAVIAAPLRLADTMPAEELAGKIVLDTNNYTIYRDGHFPMVDSGEKTIHELRQEQLPTSKVVTAFTMIRAEILLHRGRPASAPDRLALPVASDFPEAVVLVTGLNDQLGYDTVDAGPLSESWRFGPGTAAWRRADGTRDGGQGCEDLVRNLRHATRPVR